MYSSLCALEWFDTGLSLWQGLRASIIWAASAWSIRPHGDSSPSALWESLLKSPDSQTSLSLGCCNTAVRGLILTEITTGWTDWGGDVAHSTALVYRPYRPLYYTAQLKGLPVYVALCPHVLILTITWDRPDLTLCLSVIQLYAQRLTQHVSCLHVSTGWLWGLLTIKTLFNTFVGPFSTIPWP